GLPSAVWQDQTMQDFPSEGWYQFGPRSLRAQVAVRHVDRWHALPGSYTSRPKETRPRGHDTAHTQPPRRRTSRLRTTVATDSAGQWPSRPGRSQEMKLPDSTR